VFVIPFNVIHLLALLAIGTITPHKLSLMRSKGILAFLGHIAKTLLVKGEPLTTQTFEQAGLTPIGLA
jgi:hypothetical protein